DKIIATYCGEPYRTPGPNPAFQRAWQQGRVELEMWSILTLPLRLKAAAMGVPWLPTRSLLGSSMERDNAHALTVTDDPDGQGQ
ncbi:3-oxoadipate CoA-transferase, partial [Enterococcus hirae]